MDTETPDTTPTASTKPRRHPLAKERFFEGNRQRWAGIFTFIGLLIMVGTGYGWIKDPAPFLQFFLSVGVTFILGASATSVMNSWRTQSDSAQEIMKSDQDINETQNINRNENLNETINEHIERTPRPRDYDDVDVSDVSDEDIL